MYKRIIKVLKIALLKAKEINSMAYYDLQILLIIDSGFFYGVTTIKIF